MDLIGSNYPAGMGSSGICGEAEMHRLNAGRTVETFFLSAIAILILRNVN